MEKSQDVLSVSKEVLDFMNEELKKRGLDEKSIPVVCALITEATRPVNTGLCAIA